jgi:hypothetical protein
MKKINIELSRTGKPVLGVGGGSATNTFAGRFVVSQDGELKTALFVKKHGHLSNSLNQAIVPLSVGDIIVNIYGHKPVDEYNKDCHVEAVSIKSFDLSEKTAEVEDVYVTLSQVPLKIIDGIKTYHNRDGSLFVK